MANTINLNCVECKRFIGHPTTLSDVYSPLRCPGCGLILKFTDSGWVRKKVSLEEVFDNIDEEEKKFEMGVFNGRGG